MSVLESLENALIGVRVPQTNARLLAEAKEQVMALEQKVIDLQAENDDLRLQLEQGQNKERPFKRPRSESHTETLDEVEIGILKLLSHTGEEDAPADLIAFQLKISDVKAKYFLKRLEDAKYIHAAHSYLEATRYRLAHRGNEYLVKNNLV